MWNVKMAITQYSIVHMVGIVVMRMKYHFIGQCSVVKSVASEISKPIAKLAKMFFEHSRFADALKHSNLF